MRNYLSKPLGDHLLYCKSIAVWGRAATCKHDGVDVLHTQSYCISRDCITSTWTSQ